ncbi:MAG: permease-like cell division protein FtsX [Patescibacteria group bacterium]|nr:permease-like cell division protein FtsX [Patescibacteria group bacterium]
MVLSSFLRIFKFAWQSFWRNIWLSIATITIIVLAFISINSLIIIKLVTDTAINVIKDKVDISLYFRPDVTESQVQEVQSYLTSLTQVKDITYVSQADALENFKRLHRQDSVIISSLDELDSNPIGATLQVQAKNIEDYPAIMEVLNNSKYSGLIIDKNFDDHQLYITKIKNFSDNFNKIGLITSLIFLFVAALIVFNTIRVAIYTHRSEIAIMKLVGASNWFIRSPFLMEAIFYGIIACLISIAAVYPILNFIQPYVSNFFLTEQYSITNQFNQYFWEIFGLELVAIILLNIISSLIAIRRYLKV